MLITELGKEITNSMVGLFIDSKNILQNSKGEVIDIGEDTVTLRWNIDGKFMCTTIQEKLYDELKKNKVIDYLENHIEIPKSLFEPGDLVQGEYISGIIKRKEYSGIEHEWWYDILSVGGLLTEDYDIRYEREEEKYLKLMDNVNGEAYFKGKYFDIVISKHKE